MDLVEKSNKVHFLDGYFLFENLLDIFADI